jgi:carboxymethylenebutenolidase
MTDHEIFGALDEYAGQSTDRRALLKKLTSSAASTAAAYALLPCLSNNSAVADIVPKDDPRLETGYIRYPGATGDVRASLARPKGESKVPGVIVIHENRGLNPHIEDVARRVALKGFLAIAPDALSPLGGTPKDVDEARSKIQQLDSQSTVKNFVAAVQYLKTHPQTTGKVGCMGFCWGGGMTNQVAVNSPDLRAAVPFYGRQPESGDVPKIKASLLLHYAGLDRRINAGIDAFEAALKKASIDYNLHMYEGAGHAFFNDTNESRYHKEAAQLAWKRTIEFFNSRLKT